VTCQALVDTGLLILDVLCTPQLQGLFNMLSADEKEFLERARLDMSAELQIVTLVIARVAEKNPVELLNTVRNVITDYQVHAIGP
jgi:hypothetical protein